MPSPSSIFTTKELSKRTWPDFERLFSQGNGWDHCKCMGYQGGNKSGPRRAERSAINRADKLRLVEAGRAHGILVYAEREPVGWCQFGPASELPVNDDGRKRELFEDGEERKWRITCFVTHKQWQHQGIAHLALSAALAAIRHKGGGLVEAYPLPHSDQAPANTEDQVVEDLVQGVGPVNALCRWWGPAFHTGTVAMFERAGFQGIGVVPPSSRARQLARTGADDVRRTGVTRVVMQKTV